MYLPDEHLAAPAPATRSLPSFFANPLLPAPSQDPWVVSHQGTYYYCESNCDTGEIFLRSTDNFIRVGSAPAVRIWKSPPRGANSRNVWAPEIHFMDGRWYVYYAADDGHNENHRMFVLQSAGPDPFGPYHDAGQMDTDGWAIDGTVVVGNRGERYFAWSGWPGGTNGQQNLYLAPMESPLRLSGKRSLLAQPDRSWERKGMPLCEAPQVLQRQGMTFLVYSASGSWTENYCLGLMVNRDGDLLNPDSWKKIDEPVFRKTARTFGIGHCSFVQSPDGTEDWIVYHAKTKRRHGWVDRNVRAQPFSWSSNGLPHFGTPIEAGQPVRAPSARSAGNRWTSETPPLLDPIQASPAASLVSR